MSAVGDPVWALATRFPVQGDWSELDLLALPDSVRHVELSGRRLEVLPMPTDRHQSILGALYLLLAERARATGGWARPAGLRVRLTEGRIREPDVVFLRKASAAKKGEAFWTGADLVVEIVSGGADDKVRDLVTKRAEYAEADIAEYWIVDPAEETFTVLTLTNDAYREAGVFRRGERARSVLLEGLEVDVTAVLDAD